MRKYPDQADQHGPVELFAKDYLESSSYATKVRYISLFVALKQRCFVSF